ncbi:MAG TPA: alanyl-tRNA editing protein [Chloroflexia bacterium]|nr:alanyl-tRNA editing protein [Chloroflexia bacterium]
MNLETEPIYLTEPYEKEVDTEVREVLSESNGRWRVRLARTVFYPMGGGQPTDQGRLEWEGGSAKVYQVMLKEGDIWHYIETANPPSAGTKVHGEIDWARRFQNMRVHTAGHLIDYALFRMGYVPGQLAPTKADHGKKAFVQYDGTVGSGLAPEQVEAETNKLVAENLKFNWEFTSLEQLQSDAIYLQPGLPTGKPLRKLSLETVGSVADGGTILSTTGEVGQVKVTRIEERDGTATVVWYQVV